MNKKTYEKVVDFIYDMAKLQEETFIDTSIMVISYRASELLKEIANDARISLREE